MIEDVLLFNRIITSSEERNTKEYLDLCAEIVAEELEELEEASEGDSREDLLKELCDLFIVKVQLKDCLENMSLEVGLEDLQVAHQLLAFAEEDYYINTLSFPLGHVLGAIQEVNKSNMSKVPTLAQVKNVYGNSWSVAACSWIEEQYKGRYKDIQAIVKLSDEGEDRVIFRADNGKGKLVKWAGFQEANIKKYAK